MKNVIITALHTIGMTHIPSDENEPLANYGLDSLKVALLVMELERALNEPIDLSLFSEEQFKTLSSIENWLGQFETA